MPVNQRIVCARAARQEFREAYHRGIGDYRGARLASAILGRHLAARLPDALPLAPLQRLYDAGVAELAWEGSVERANGEASARPGRFRVMARKRPLLEEERLGGAYDSVSLEGPNSAVVVHDGRVHRDGRSLYMVHSRFCLDHVFGEHASNDAVYEAAARPLLREAAAGGRATLLLFGQTGTGKTYTSSGMLDRLAADIFGGAAGVGRPHVRVLCYELVGAGRGRDGCFDLLSERAKVRCLQGEDGQVHVRGARAAECGCAADFRAALAAAFARRSSESTERNESSSRSHAIVELHLGCPDSQEGCAGGVGGGVLRLVDLAGSERNYETQQHTRSMAERGGSINYSLLMLKECARIMHHNRRLLGGAPGKQRHVPFRSSLLTHLLQSCFTDEAHRTVVISTLSPSPTDVEHSLNSLQHVGMMRSPQEPLSGPAQPAARRGGREAAGSEGGFGALEGRGHALHSKLQDARASQLKLHAFNTEMLVGGSIQKKYDPEAVKQEAFIDPRWHREMNVEVEQDLWVLKEADAEVVQLLTAWREEQWRQRQSHDLSRWDAKAVQEFVASLELPGQARLPSTLTGPQLQRLGLRGLRALCSDGATAEALHAALLGEQAAGREAAASQRSNNAKITALGSLKVHAISSSAAGS